MTMKKLSKEDLMCFREAEGVHGINKWIDYDRIRKAVETVGVRRVLTPWRFVARCEECGMLFRIDLEDLDMMLCNPALVTREERTQVGDAVVTRRVPVDVAASRICPAECHGNYTRAKPCDLAALEREEALEAALEKRDALVAAARGGAAAEVREALSSAGADATLLKTLLGLACAFNPHAASVRLLLEAVYRADPRYDINGAGSSEVPGDAGPLHLAAASNPSPDVVMALLEYGAEPRITMRASRVLSYGETWRDLREVDALALAEEYELQHMADVRAKAKVSVIRAAMSARPMAETARCQVRHPGDPIDLVICEGVRK